MSKLLSRVDIENAQDFKFEDVEVPEWNGTVRIKTMTGSERDRFEGSIVGKNGGVNPENIRAKLLTKCICDEQGNLLFKETDLANLGKKSCKALDRLFTVAQKLNGIGDSEVETLAKNS